MLYCSNCIRSKDGVDLYKCNQSSSCFDSVDLYDCYSVFCSQFCFNCSNSWYIAHCTGCSDCYGCINLVNKKYCIFNEQYTPEEYKQRRETIENQSTEEQKNSVQKFFLSQPHLYFR